MKFKYLFILCCGAFIILSCNKESNFEYPIEPDFLGKFVFSRKLTGAGHLGAEIFSLSQLGTDQITSGCLDNNCSKDSPQWIFPGDKILYHFNGIQGIKGFYVTDKDGSKDHLIIPDELSSNRYGFDVAEDGKLFARFGDGWLGMYRFEADSLALIDTISWTDDGSVVFSPNNELVAIFDNSLFQGLRMGIHHIGQPGIISYSMSGDVQSTDDPNFSYLSDKIVFKFDGDIWVIHSDGSNPEKIFNTSNQLESNPVWSPVEDCIAFSRQPYKHPNEPCELILFNYINKTEQVILSTKSITFISDIQWSADGQQLAFHNYDEPNEGAFTINKDGSDIKRISKEPYSLGDWLTN